VAVNARLLRRQINTTIEREFPNTKQLIQWIYYPTQRWVWDAIRGHAKVYECYDDYPRAANGVFDDALWAQEQHVLREADLTFATATSLVEARTKIARQMRFLPNGVPDFFFDEPTAVHDEMIQLIPHPRIGYLGNIFSHLDYPLLEELFQLNPQWHLMLVGPVENHERVVKLRSLKNVHFVGPRPYSQVPSVLRQMDVGLIPFLDNTFTRAINPLKLYEYLAVGLPTVATKLPELDRFKNVIWLPRNTVRDYQAAITEAISKPPRQNKSDLVAAAMPYAWSNIARQHVLPPIMELLNRR
jgi:glycosyltransferase involved in cell wall biosynthesis